MLLALSPRPGAPGPVTHPGNVLEALAQVGLHSSGILCLG